MIKMARICDICGREIGTYNSRYTLTYKSILYSKEKDICPLCFEKLQKQFKEHKAEDEPQTEKADRIPYDPLVEMDIKRMVEARLAQTDCAWKKGENDE